MKIELTDKQIESILEQVPKEKLFDFLARNKRQTFNMIISLLTLELNYEEYIEALKQIICSIPIQKELF